MSREILHHRVDHDFTTHTPPQHRIDDIEDLRHRFKDVAHVAIGTCPEGRELSLALSHLEMGLMYAVAAIARET